MNRFLTLMQVALLAAAFGGVVYLFVALPNNPNAKKAREERAEQAKLSEVAKQSVLPTRTSAVVIPNGGDVTPRLLRFEEKRGEQAITQNDKETFSLFRLGDLGCFSTEYGQKNWFGGMVCWSETEAPEVIRAYLFEGKVVPPGYISAHKDYLVSSNNMDGDTELMDFPNLGIACLSVGGKFAKCWDREAVPPAIINKIAGSTFGRGVK